MSLAFDVAQSNASIRRRTIVATLENLEIRLRAAEYGGDLEVHSKCKEAARWTANTSFLVHHASWQDQYTVSLEAFHSNARDLLVGFARPPGGAVPDGLETALIKSINHSPVSSGWYPWFHWLDQPYVRWDTRDAIEVFADEVLADRENRASFALFNYFDPIIRI